MPTRSLDGTLTANVNQSLTRENAQLRDCLAPRAIGQGMEICGPKMAEKMKTAAEVRGTVRAWAL